MNDSRRSFIRKSAIAGGVAWAAPTVLSVPKAMAQEGPGTPKPGCPCQGQGTALGGEVTVLGQATVPIGPFGQSSGAEACVIPPIAVGPVTAKVLCGEFDATTCRAEATVAEVFVDLADGIGATVLQSFADAPETQECAGGSLGAQIATLTIAGQSQTISGQPNQAIAIPGGLGQVIINEQICDGAETIVRALHIIVNVPMVAAADVRVAESRVTSECCPCLALAV